MVQGNEPFIHSLADVQTKNIGVGTRIWQFVVVLAGARLGRDCNVCSHCFIENDVVIGDRVTIKSGVQLWDGLRIDDDVFVGPNVSFSNDKFPRSREHLERRLETHIAAGASVGAGATILPGITVGSQAMIGAGAVVTRSVPSRAIVVGSPGRIVGYVDTEIARALKPEGAADPDGNVAGAYPARVRGVSLHRFQRHADMRGSLTAGEFERTVPFAPRRYFMVFDVPSAETRGEHAHRQCHQFLICVRGSCSVIVDDGATRQEFELDNPQMGLYVPPLTWSIQYKYSPDAALLVFASDFYDPNDYIRDYAEFRKLLER